MIPRDPIRAINARPIRDLVLAKLALLKDSQRNTKVILAIITFLCLALPREFHRLGTTR